MKEKFSIFITKSKSIAQSEIEINIDSLENLDRVIANNFNNYQELRDYIMKYVKKHGIIYPSYNPYPKIKIVTKDKKQKTINLTPIYELIDKKRIVELCLEALNNKENYKRYLEQLTEISNVLKPYHYNYNEIPYIELRELVFPLKQMKIRNVTDEVLVPNEKYNIEHYIVDKNNKLKQTKNDSLVLDDNYYKFKESMYYTTDNLSFEEQEYANYLKTRILEKITKFNKYYEISIEEYEELESLYDELCEICNPRMETNRKKDKKYLIFYLN